MAYYLSNERNQDVVAGYQRYQQYLREHEHEFPVGAFALGTAEWYQNAHDHRCPHDGRLENFIISEIADSNGKRLAIRIRLLGAYHDGYIELFYPQVFGFNLETASRAGGLGDWLYDEFRVSSEGHLIHQVEWAGFPSITGTLGD